MKFKVLSKFFGKQTLGGSHPNCEARPCWYLMATVIGPFPVI